MAFLQLSDIGKIYVAEGNVAVGIRGVSLSFERGEFVAVTGQSGSGKSTLLNVISGMDTYEEGELYIEGQSTSHYVQADWEEYRKKYISFIFQDYNIIDSFTVLENVELALMHIEDKKQRRARALELIERVGLTSHIRHKGSKLSGGQKQRTVIARALAKDSPIILADEPTGNLDSATSRQIIDLLREVSRDKLLIVVTHNFEDFEEYATRHIRVFDGAVESDHAISEPRVSDTEREDKRPAEYTSVKAQRRMDIKNGVTLGKSIFTSRPRLSAFLCLLMAVGTLGIFFVTSLCGEATAMFDKSYMFTPMEGRVILTRRDGAVISEAELEKISQEYATSDILKCDKLLDAGVQTTQVAIDGKEGYTRFEFLYDADLGTVIGDYPSADNEVLMYVPISYTEFFGKDPADFGDVYIADLKFKVTGVKYYIDNNLTPKCALTKSGFDILTGVYYLKSGAVNITASVNVNGTTVTQSSYGTFLPSFDVERGKIYVDDNKYNSALSASDGAVARIDFSSTFHNYNYYSNVDYRRTTFEHTFDGEEITVVAPEEMYARTVWGGVYTHQIAINPYLLKDIADEVLSQSYRQVSLFFEDNQAAEEAIALLNNQTYMAVSSYETYTPDAITAMSTVISSMMLVLVWVLAILFLAFFINLCSSRTLSAFKGDMAIMRSMGIPVRSIRVGMYVRMLISLIPAYIAVIITAILIFTIPSVNSFFTYLYAWQYVAIFAGMLILTVRVTKKQIKRLFGQSVKKALRGGASND